MAEGAGLLNQYTGNRIVGSNPTLSANLPREVSQPSGSLPGVGPAMRAVQRLLPPTALPGHTEALIALHSWQRGQPRCPVTRNDRSRHEGAFTPTQ